MASDVVSPASHTESCLLFKLPPELRLNIYHYTHQLRLDNPDSSTDALNQSWASSWESSPLVQLAATCHLIANEVRPIVRFLPTSQRVAHLELTDANPESLQVRLRHLPCPLTDLRRIVFTFDAGSLRSVRTFTFKLYFGLRRFITHSALDKCAELKHFHLRLTEHQRTGCEESCIQAMRRILDLKRAEGAERVVQEIFY
jgi:hypothetical protein